MSSDDCHFTTWTECPAGTLHGMIDTRINRRRQHRLQRAASALAVIVMVSAGLAAFATLRANVEPEYYYGGIACTDVRSHLRAFAAGEVSGETAEQMKIHLQQCPTCQKLMRSMSDQPMTSAVVQPIASAVVTPANFEGRDFASVNSRGRTRSFDELDARVGASVRQTIWAYSRRRHNVGSFSKAGRKAGVPHS